GVEAVLGALPQPRLDVAADRLDAEVGTQARELRAAPERRRRDPGALRHLVPRPGGTGPGVARVGPLQARPEGEPLRLVGGEILGAVHGDVDASVAQGLLDLAR